MKEKINGIDVSEEIIIDGVDVAGCKNLYVPQESKIYQCLDCETGEIVQCKREVYCYFKQLKRLQQENKELRQIRKNSPDIQEPYIYLYRQIKKQCHKLQEKNEELKELIGKTRYNRLEIYESFETECNKYKQALEKIKKWATNHNPCDIDAEVKCTKEDCFKCLNYDIKKITKIINEVLYDKD